MNTTTELSTGHYRRRARRRGLAIAAGFILAASSLLTAGTVLADSVTVTTEVQDENGSTSSPFDLGSIVHDIVTILTSGGADIPDGSSVSFEFYTDDTCTTLSPPVEGVSVGPASSPVSISSSPLGPLHAGDYSYKVWFNSGVSSAVSDGVSACEPFSVAMAPTTTTTAVNGLSNASPWVHNPVHDEATVDTDGYDGFDLDSDVTFTIFDNQTCDGNVVGSPEDVGIAGTPPQTVASGDSTLDPGYYSYQAEYQGNSDYEGSVSPCEPFTVVPAVEVLRGSCTFDLNPDVDGDQFNLIFTPFTSNWKLNASNPGQMFVDIFFINGTDGTDGDAYLNMPYPFVTQGAMPVHFYDGVTITEDNGKFCYEPGDGLGASDEMVTLEDYSGDPPALNSTFEMEIEDVPAATSGLTLIRIHIDYGLKWEAFDCVPTDPLNPDPPNDAECDLPRYGDEGDDYLIPDFQEYTFSVGVATTDSDTIESQNQFKKIKGFAGLVLSASGDPFAGVQVQIWQGTKLWKVVTTDEDGWYMAEFKYTGKPTTFTVKIIDLGIQKSVALKSNGFAVVSFYGDYSEFTFIDLTTTDTSTDSGGSTGGDSGGDSGGDTGGGGKGKGGGGGGGKKP